MNVDPSGITRDRSWRGGACGRSRAARAAASARSNMMACNETRGPLFTKGADGRLGLDGVMLYQRPFGPGIRMASSATEPIRGRNMDGVMESKPPCGAAGIHGGSGPQSRPAGRRALMGVLVFITQRLRLFPRPFPVISRWRLVFAAGAYFGDSGQAQDLGFSRLEVPAGLYRDKGGPW